MPSFIELDRLFSPFAPGVNPHVDAGALWGSRYLGWETWEQLLARPRVVVLAEAGSGKTAEFRACAERLTRTGAPAFFLAIEDLADADVSSCLGPERWLGLFEQSAPVF
jgi:hypothetical protein